MGKFVFVRKRVFVGVYRFMYVSVYMSACVLCACLGVYVCFGLGFVRFS